MCQAEVDVNIVQVSRGASVILIPQALTYSVVLLRIRAA